MRVLSFIKRCILKCFTASSDLDHRVIWANIKLLNIFKLPTVSKLRTYSKPLESRKARKGKHGKANIKAERSTRMLSRRKILQTRSYPRSSRSSKLSKENLAVILPQGGFFDSPVGKGIKINCWIVWEGKCSTVFLSPVRVVVKRGGQTIIKNHSYAEMSFVRILIRQLKKSTELLKKASEKHFINHKKKWGFLQAFLPCFSILLHKSHTYRVFSECSPNAGIIWIPNSRASWHRQVGDIEGRGVPLAHSTWWRHITAYSNIYAYNITTHV